MSGGAGAGAGRPVTPDHQRETDPTTPAAEQDGHHAPAQPDAPARPGPADAPAQSSPPDAPVQSSPADAPVQPGPADAAALPAPPASPSPADAQPSSSRASVVAVEAASADIDAHADSSGLPGQHRGGFSRLPTAPVAVTVPSGPAADDEVHWDPAPQAGPQRGIAVWALAFAVLGLAVSMFVGWGFPIGLVGVASGVIALRRPTESRALAGWAIVLGTASLIYSAGWLWFAATQANLIY